MAYSFAHGHIKKAVPQNYVVISDKMKEDQHCVRCKEIYREFENIGQWQCVMHTLQLDSITNLFACCGTTLKGCIKCDHSASLEDPYPNSTIPPGSKVSVYAFRIEGKYADQMTNLVYGDKRIVTTSEDPTALYILRREIKG